MPFHALLSRPLALLCTGWRLEQDSSAGNGGYLRRTRTGESSRGWFGQAVRRAVSCGLRRTTCGTTSLRSIRREREDGAVDARPPPAGMTLDTYADLFDDDLEVITGRLI